MKVVLDTNVLVSGLVQPFGPPGEIVRMAAAGILELCYDARILTEYKEVLARPKFGLEKPLIDVFIEQIRARGHSIVGEPLIAHLSDRDDEMFLEIAIAGHVEYLVTGNLKHYRSSIRQSIKVVSPREFLDK